MRRFLFRFVQCTWGLPQTFIGLLIFLFSGRRCVTGFHGAVVSRWRYRYSVSLGLFIFLSEDAEERLLVHEYGHCVQSLLLGWLYVPPVLLPSVLWLRLPVCRRYRRRKCISYYSFVTERWADDLGFYVHDAHR